MCVCVCVCTLNALFEDICIVRGRVPKDVHVQCNLPAWLECTSPYVYFKFPRPTYVYVRNIPGRYMHMSGTFQVDICISLDSSRSIYVDV